MMTFKDKVQSDLDAFKRVLKMLQENDCGEKAIAGVTGMIEGCENVLKGLKDDEYCCCLLAILQT